MLDWLLHGILMAFAIVGAFMVAGIVLWLVAIFTWAACVAVSSK